MQKDQWTEPRLLSLPTDEQNYFERKSGAILKDSDCREKLAKAISAFANSGGGHLIIGVQNDGSIDGVPAIRKGRTSTKDWLEQTIPNLVSYPLQNFSVHEVIPEDPSAIPKDKVVIVIDIGDSMEAPHQSSITQVYFCRMGGRSEPALHHYLEMLRGRERYPSRKIAHAWLNFVITPLLKQLRSEQQNLVAPQQPWDGYHMSYGSYSYFSSFADNLSANEIQFLKYYPGIRPEIDKHDNALTRMREEAERLVNTIQSSSFMSDACARFRTSEYLQRIRERYRGRLAERDDKLSDSLFGDRPEEQTRKSLATFITYDYPQTEEPHYLWPLWSTYKPDLMELLRYSLIKEQNDELIRAREELLEYAKSFIAALEEIQHELAVRHGEPYEDSTLHRTNPEQFMPI
jgi:hypothetical protein